MKYKSGNILIPITIFSFLVVLELSSISQKMSVFDQNYSGFLVQLLHAKTHILPLLFFYGLLMLVLLYGYYRLSKKFILKAIVAILYFIFSMGFYNYAFSGLVIEWFYPPTFFTCEIVIFEAYFLIVLPLLIVGVMKDKKETLQNNLKNLSDNLNSN